MRLDRRGIAPGLVKREGNRASNERLTTIRLHRRLTTPCGLAVMSMRRDVMRVVGA
jgi:hypothetical protein